MRTLPILMTALALAACAAPPQNIAPAVTPETVKLTPADLAPKAAPTVAVQREKPKITSQQLLGQGGAWVKAQLGDPGFVRTDQSAHLWQYKNGSCVLNVFLYPDEGNAPRVLHFDARNSNGGNTDRDRCLALLQN